MSSSPPVPADVPPVAAPAAPVAGVADTAPRDPVVARLLASRKDLLDLTLRNPLLNSKVYDARGVECIGEHIHQVYEHLVVNEKSMKFHATKASKADGAVVDAPLKPRRRRKTENLTVNVSLSITGVDGERADVTPAPAGEPAPAAVIPADAELGADGKDILENSLATPYTRETLDRRLTMTAYDAWLSLQERGCNTLYLTAGMLQWTESDAPGMERRYAPLVLIPVRVERRSTRSGWTVTVADEDPGINISLSEKLKEFGITAPPAPDLDTLEGFTGYLDAWEVAIKDQRSWVIDRSTIRLGFFSFARFLMWRDLDPAAWPEGHEPSEHRLLRGLFVDGFRGARSDADQPLDERRPPGEAVEILDCDGSQAAAIAVVHEGRDLVIHGPPGTGKSQTIANIIADAVDQGKRVLFVAEKLAALEVVKRRMDACGLGALCLELHSDKANKRDVVESLRSTLSLGRPEPVPEEQLAASLPEHRAKLNRYAVAASQVVPPTTYTPFQAFGRALALTADTEALPRFRSPLVEHLDQAGYGRARQHAGELASHLAKIGVPDQHPFTGCAISQITPQQVETVDDDLANVERQGEALRAAAASLGSFLSLAPAKTRQGLLDQIAISELLERRPPCETLSALDAAWDPPAVRSAWSEFVALAGEWERLRSTWKGKIQPEAWGRDPVGPQAVVSTLGGSWFHRWFSGEYKKARLAIAGWLSVPVPKLQSELLAICDALLTERRLQSRVAELAKTLAPRLETNWKGLATDRATVESILAWVQQYRHAIRSLPGPDLARLGCAVIDRDQVAGLRTSAQTQLTTWIGSWNHVAAFVHTDERIAAPWDEILALVAVWRRERGKLIDWCSYQRSFQALFQLGLKDLLLAIAAGRVPGDRIVMVIDRCWAELAADRAFAQRPELAHFDPEVHQQVIERFRQADGAVFAVNRQRLASRHWQGLPPVLGYGQVGTLRREVSKKAKFMPLRLFLNESGAAIQQVKPVFMMSPLSVAAYLPPGRIAFDLVVFDEASQVRPVDSLGAILRARQVVVVGDEQQMPPTNFFDRLIGDEPDPDEDPANVPATADHQSILGMCLGRGMRQEMLRWHYRSRHDSLIALSNQEFYRNELVVFPSPRRSLDGEGLVYTHLPDSAYERGTSRTNPKEAEAVVAAIIAHVRTQPNRSLGVVAFSQAQRRAIEDRLEAEMTKDPTIEAALGACRPEERYFIKNLENVQGDERDVIFISVGYGKDAAGHLTMNFGPLGHGGGERRLNVLITRARVCCRVFTNLSANDIDLQRAQGAGTKVFKQFLQFAASGRLEMSAPTGREHDSPFEIQVHDAIKRLSYDAEPQVGSGGYRIDLAIINPTARGTYLLGIECDGAQYHSSQWARDRDRLREAVLRGLGWRIHRIWSTSWFTNRDAEIARLHRAITTAIAEDHSGAPPASVPAATAVVRDPQHLPLSKLRVQPYQPARLTDNTGGMSVVDIPPTVLGRHLAKLIELEAPIHIEEIRRRLLNALEARSGSRRLAAIDVSLESAQREGLVRQDGEFWWPVRDVPVKARDRSDMVDASRDARMIHALEWESAAVAVVADGHGCASINEVVQQAIVALGAKRNDAAQESARLAVQACIERKVLRCDQATGQVTLQPERQDLANDLGIPETIDFLNGGGAP